MFLASMTGFARTSGFAAPYLWAWELKTVNSRGLDVRLRLPPGFDELEAPARAAISGKLARGTCHANLSMQRAAVVPEARINRGLLASLVESLRGLPAFHGLAPVSLDALLSIRGVVEIVEPDEDVQARAEAILATKAGLELALADLVITRQGEGLSLGLVLAQRLANISRLVAAAQDCPGRQPEAIRARLAETVAILLGTAHTLDSGRLYQEAVLIATRADVREELDRLVTHVAAVRTLLDAGGPVGRRLDFLAQELGREANTLSAKSNDAALTSIGLELRAEIEQMREQAQNIE